MRLQIVKFVMMNLTYMLNLCLRFKFKYPKNSKKCLLTAIMPLKYEPKLF